MINKAIDIAVALILLSALILPIAGTLVQNGSWSDVGISSGLASGLILIVIVVFLFNIVKQNKGGKKS
jgi:hypothetical protein